MHWWGVQGVDSERERDLSPPQGNTFLGSRDEGWAFCGGAGGIILPTTGMIGNDRQRQARRSVVRNQQYEYILNSPVFKTFLETVVFSPTQACKLHRF